MDKKSISLDNISFNLKWSVIVGIAASVAYAVIMYSNIVSIQTDHEKRLTIVETNYTAINRSVIKLENQLNRIDERTVLILDELRNLRNQ